MVYMVFVYGTLKTGEPNHYLMEKETVGICILKGRARTVNKYPLVVASRYNLPFMLAAEGKGHKICGEVYAVDADRLARLDILENHPKLYERQDLELEMIDGEAKGEKIRAVAYMLVKYQPHLLDLRMVENYTDPQDEMTYIGPSDRDPSSIPSPLWWYEVHRDYTEPNLS